MTTAQVFSMAEPTGSYLGTVEFYRRPDGSIFARLTDMPAHVVESMETITERFDQAARWCREGAPDLNRQGQVFANGGEGA